MVGYKIGTYTAARFGGRRVSQMKNRTVSRTDNIRLTMTFAVPQPSTEPEVTANTNRMSATEGVSV